MSEVNDPDLAALYSDLHQQAERFRRREAEFEEVMAWLGKMVAASNLTELTFQRFVVLLLQCKNYEVATVVVRERRRFEDLVELTERLFAIDFADQSLATTSKVWATVLRNCTKSATSAFTQCGC